MRDERRSGAVEALRKLIPDRLVLAGIIFVIVFTVVSSAAVMRRPDIVYSAPRVELSQAKASVMQWMRENSEMPDRVLSKVYDAAFKSVNPELVLAICVVESNFNPTARSDKGAVGLMGIMPDVWLGELRSRGIVSDSNDLYAIRNNIAAGVYVLNSYLSRTNNLEKALVAYVGGDSSYPDKVLKARRAIYLVRKSGASI